MSSVRPVLWAPLALIVLLLVLEGLLKAWAVETLSPGINRPLMPGVLHLGFTYNTGMAWGLLGSFAVPLAILRLLVGLGLIGALLMSRVRPLFTWPVALIAAGSIGNALDGLARGAVVDYLTSPLLDRVSNILSSRPFPIFNLSDVLVCVGVAALLVASWWQERRTQRQTSPTPTTSLQENI
ncbi:signal peptidase II [Deinococcus sp. HMF7604]|uniref:signal peptidase II n=1 Tax=Deinococcus betulae TaxID=2873312 RepID=UPI001CC9BE99|nr:signal peptidase II [Deinococcus betulae]MBZ9752878.1 signal peptidase II [Deinococcus betulae]